MDKLIQQLQEIADSQDMPPKAIARKAYLGVNTVYHFFGRHKSPRYDTMEAIALALGYELDIRKKG